MIGCPSCEDTKEQKTFLAHAILNPFHPFKVETNTLPQTKNEAKRFEDVSLIDAVTKTEVSDVRIEEARPHSICRTIPKSIDHGYVDVDAKEMAVRTLSRKWESNATVSPRLHNNKRYRIGRRRKRRR